MAFPCAIPGINLSDYGRMPRPGWPGACSGSYVTVRINDAGARVTVDAAIGELVGLIMRANERDGYHYRPADTGAQNCRRIGGSGEWSMHAYGLAIDQNWTTNPMVRPLRTDMPEWLIRRWNRYGFAWGGHYVPPTANDCLTGDTMIITADGPRPIADLSGQDVELLTTTEDPRQRGVTATEWVKAPVASYGFQRIYEIVVRRRGARQTVRCSPGHRWPVRAGNGSIRFVTAETLAASLRQGDTIPALQYPDAPTALDERAIAQGIVWGDGSVYNKQDGRTPQATVELCGSKVDLRPYIEPYARYWRDTDYGPRAWGMPAELKDVPHPDEPLPVLAGFFAGWFACDGHISGVGASLSSSDPRAVAWIHKVAPRLGLTITGTSVQPAGRSGYGSTKDNHQIRFRQIPAHLLITERHITAEQPARRWFNWTVESVRDTGLFEETYCPTVDDRHVVALHTPTVPLLTGQSMHVEWMGTPAQVGPAVALARAELGGGAPAAPSGPTTADPNDEILTIGDTGPAVLALQQTLNRWYPKETPLTEDGEFGQATKDRVAFYQAAAGLTADGEVGPATRAGLGLQVPSSYTQAPAAPPPPPQPPGVKGEIQVVYETVPGLRDAIGAPITAELGTPDGRGRYNHFANGASIYWTPETGAFVVMGAIRDAWTASGWERGPLGYPTSSEFTVVSFDRAGQPKAWQQSNFEHGHITFTPVAGVTVYT